MATEQRLQILEVRDGLNGCVTGGFLIPKGLVEIVEVSASDLGSPADRPGDALFRAAHDWARSRKYVAAFPLCVTSGSSYSPKHKLAVFRENIAEIREVPVGKNGLARHPGSFDDSFRAVHDYAGTQQALGFPTFHTTGDGAKRTYSIVLVKGQYIYQEATFAELGNVSICDGPGLIAAMQRVAETRNAALLIPHFHYGRDVDPWHLNEVLLKKEGWRIASVQQLSVGAKVVITLVLEREQR